MEIISDEVPDFQDLAQVEYAITHGGCSGMWEVMESGRLTRQQARRALEAQGTDPAFLLGDGEEQGPDQLSCTGCGYQDDPGDEGSSMCRDCGDCEDCCWENHGGGPHARGA